LSRIAGSGLNWSEHGPRRHSVTPSEDYVAITVDAFENIRFQRGPFGIRGSIRQLIKIAAAVCHYAPGLVKLAVVSELLCLGKLLKRLTRDVLEIYFGRD
jgi:hypothetical protein